MGKACYFQQILVPKLAYLLVCFLFLSLLKFVSSIFNIFLCQVINT